MKQLFYKTKDPTAVADCIPYYENGVYHIFYLLDLRNPNDIGTPWCKITTTDFVHFKDHGEMLKRGTHDEYDMYVFTGSVIKDKKGLYHIWYTGHNTVMDPGNYLQAVMHAVSEDLEHWTKIPEDTFTACEGFEIRDWRDPFVYFDEEDQLFHMLLSTRKEGGPTRRRGTTSMLVSSDNKHWEVKESFYEPELYYAHECPDLFKIGDWYYHVFSEFSRYSTTRYVMSKSLKGPWIKPENDKFDGRAFYAAKTVGDGKRRFVIGWNPTKEGNIDSGVWQWGGNVEIHEIIQNPDGTLSVKMPKEVDEAFDEGEPLSFVDRFGKPKDVSHMENITGAEIAYCDVPKEDVYRIDFDFAYEEGTSRIGFLLNNDLEADAGYGYFIEPLHNRVVFEQFPIFPQYSFVDVYLERPLHLKPKQINHVSVIVQGTIAVCYINDTVALSTRMYNFNTQKVGLLVHGKATLSNIKFKRFRKGEK